MTGIPFSTRYDPPAPVAQLTLTAHTTNRQVTLDGLLDTGADPTLIPVGHLRAIGARRVFATGLRSQWGERRQVFLYLVDIRINDVTLAGQYVVGDEIGQESIVSRNVLNQLRITFDGPGLLTEILAGI
jgi:hypothetical protein